MTELLNVQGLETQFHTREGNVHAVNGVSFSLKEGETLGIVGESGCGKSVTVMSMLRLIPTPPGKIAGGKAMFQGKDLLAMTTDEIRHVRGSQISMVFQDPMTSFNPNHHWTPVAEPLEIQQGMNHKQPKIGGRDARKGGHSNPRDWLNDYPTSFRRDASACDERMSLVCAPQILSPMSPPPPWM